MRLADPQVADPISAMSTRFNLVFRGFAQRYFRGFELGSDKAARLRELEDRGSVVYVMRYASRLDYFLFNWLFLREGLRLSAFANGVSFYYYQPLAKGLPQWWQRRRLGGAGRQASDRERARQKTREVVASGQSMFLFLRTAQVRSWLISRRTAAERERREADLLSEIVQATWDGEREVHVVPLALFWRKGPRSEKRFLNLAYGSPTRPSDVAKITSFALTYRGLAVRVGEAIDLRGFLAERREEGQETLVRKVRRALLLFLYREERAVEGPVLRPLHKVQEQVLADRGVQRAIRTHASERKATHESARADAEKMFREIAANMNPTFLAILNVVVKAIFGRLFASIETRGIENVANYAKQHPVVLLPSHRSYFDFLILSWIFYANHLVPPHIAARDNMGFGPFGFIFRRAGAYFMRKSFADPLYKEVFRAYLGHLVREGFTQEFFIEGGRSRTGKTLAPRLGMLQWTLEAFAESGRRDLFLIPVAIGYERLVEEGALVEELEGGKKKAESMLGLVRARKLLQRRFGSVFLNFGEPISLAQALEGRRDLYLDGGTEDDVRAQRALTEQLAHSVVERINWAMAANATSVAAAALLGQPRRGLFRTELVDHMREILELLRLQDAVLTPALVADEPGFEESIAFLLRAGLINSREDSRGEILFYDESRRRALDVYRNVLFHFLATPSVMARRLLGGATLDELREDLAFWLDLLYVEFLVPKGLVMAVQLDAFLDYFERGGALERSDGTLRSTEKGRPYFHFLAEQTRSLLEAYYASLSAIAEISEPATGKVLEKAAQEQFERASLLGEVQRREGWNTVTFRNALDLMTRRSILVRDTGSRDPLYRPGLAFDDLVALRERLAGALTDR